MKNQHYVSLWLVKGADYDTVDKYLTVGYNVEGDSIPAGVEVDFGLEYYDEDVRDAFYAEKQVKTYQELLDGCSYSETVIPNLVKALGEKIPQEYQGGFLLYDCEYPGTIREVKKAGWEIGFMASVPYQKSS